MQEERKNTFTFKDNKANIRFNSNFYTLEIINQAKEAYKEICEIDIEQEENDFIVNLTPKTDEATIEEISYEFSNYVLGLIKNQE